MNTPHTMHYTWKGDADADDVTDVTYLLREIPGGTRFTWRHTGFTGAVGFAMSRLLGSVRKKMLTEGPPARTRGVPPLVRAAVALSG